MLSFSQSGQDVFVLSHINKGYYLEIGASHPININNTFLLEQRGWDGLSIDIDPMNVKEWEKYRTRPLIIRDAFLFDYPIKQEIDYLQIDIEPPQKNYEYLLQILEIRTPKIITFETDYYYDTSIRDKSREYILSKGYILEKPGVCCDLGEYEDWYIHKSLKYGKD